MKEPTFNMKIVLIYRDNVSPKSQENARRFYKDKTRSTVKQEFKNTTVFFFVLSFDL